MNPILIGCAVGSFVSGFIFGWYAKPTKFEIVKKQKADKAEAED